MDSATVNHISEWFIKPELEVLGSNQPYHLGPWDLVRLSAPYIQKGLLFTKPNSHSNHNGEKFTTTNLLQSLMQSLSLALLHFYPLSGQLVTEVDHGQHQSVVFVDCNKGPGARFIHATLVQTVSDILSPTYVPSVVRSFFDHDRAISHDGHTRPLLSVQVTELLDGIFIGCSMNHAVADGVSYWRFWNTWSEIHRANTSPFPVPRIPLHQRWCLDGYSLPIPLPFTHPSEFVTKIYPHHLRERFFHFSSESIARLRCKAIEESNNSKISSFQALSAHVWRSIIRASKYSTDEVTICRLTADNRHRLNPPLSQDYFGNALNQITTSTTVGELGRRNLGWSASMLHQSVANQTDTTLREFVKAWIQSPFVFQFKRKLEDDTSIMMMGSSPRFDMYGNDFGLGKPLAVRSGSASKPAGKVIAYPGCESDGSIDFEICLPPHIMTTLETDHEFMSSVSLSCNEY